VADIYYNLGIIYYSLPVVSLKNLEDANTCFELARQFYNRVDNRPAYAAALYNLGNLYSDRPGEDRQTDLELAISYYKEASDIYQASEEYTIPAAATNRHLGDAYRMLPGEARMRRKNLEAAITRYNYAHSAYTKMQMPDQAQEVQTSIAQTQALLQNIGQA
jgi:tetratricopeptide (TPR) repeat protein